VGLLVDEFAVDHTPFWMTWNDLECPIQLNLRM